MISLRQRLIVSTLVGSIILTLTMGLFLAFVFSSSIERQFDQQLQSSLTDLVGASSIKENKFHLKAQDNATHFSNLFSGWYWEIIDLKTKKSVFKSKSLQETSLFNFIDAGIKQNLQFDKTAVISINMEGPVKEPIRVYGRFISFPEINRPLLYLVSGSSEILANELRYFYGIIAVGLAILVFALTLASYFQLKFVLNPLVSLKNYLAKIRTGDGKSIEAILPKEITPVANEINNLLNANEKVIDRARTHVGNLAHALKTPISVLLNAANSEDEDIGKLVNEQVTLMNIQITHHLNRAQMIASTDGVATKINVKKIIDPIINALNKIYYDKNVIVKFEISGDLNFLGEKQDLEELVGNLIDNAFKWCDGQICLTVSTAQNAFEITQLYICVEDNGKFIPIKELQKVMVRGHRIDENMDGSGLGLSIVKELTELYYGQFKLSQSDLKGLKAELWLPLA